MSNIRKVHEYLKTTERYKSYTEQRYKEEYQAAISLDHRAYVDPQLKAKLKFTNPLHHPIVYAFFTSGAYKVTNIKHFTEQDFYNALLEVVNEGNKYPVIWFEEKYQLFLNLVTKNDPNDKEMIDFMLEKLKPFKENEKKLQCLYFVFFGLDELEDKLDTALVTQAVSHHQDQSEYDNKKDSDLDESDNESNAESDTDSYSDSYSDSHSDSYSDSESEIEIEGEFLEKIAQLHVSNDYNFSTKDEFKKEAAILLKEAKLHQEWCSINPKHKLYDTNTKRWYKKRTIHYLPTSDGQNLPYYIVVWTQVKDGVKKTRKVFVREKDYTRYNIDPTYVNSPLKMQ
jgi:hypothetical protein